MGVFSNNKYLDNENMKSEKEFPYDVVVNK